jgi:hypothetical protein
MPDRKHGPRRLPERRRAAIPPAMSHRLLTVALVAVTFCSAPVALFVSACSSDDEGAVSDGADAEADAKKKDRAAEPDEEIPDATPDVAVAPVVLPNCVGEAIPMEVSGVRAFVDVQLGGLPDGGYATRGDFVVDFGTISSTIDLAHGFADAGAPVPAICGADAGAGEPGIWCEFNGFRFFGEWGRVTLTTADHSVLAGAKRQAGILGTDFLALNPFTLHFKDQRMFRADPKAFCSDAQLLAAGLRPLPSQGFFATDLSKLRPLGEVLTDPDASVKNISVPNVPTVPVTIDGEPALAQLDTGYEDRIVRNSINVNEAMLERLLAQKKVVRVSYRDIFATTCVAGLNEKLEAYQTTAAAVLEFIGEGGAVARSAKIEAVYLKRRSAETFKCGGISTWTVPAAQVGASFFIDAQAMIVDPTTSRVWIPRN